MYVSSSFSVAVVKNNRRGRNHVTPKSESTTSPRKRNSGTKKTPRHWRGDKRRRKKKKTPPNDSKTTPNTPKVQTTTTSPAASVAARGECIFGDTVTEPEGHKTLEEPQPIPVKIKISIAKNDVVERIKKCPTGEFRQKRLHVSDVTWSIVTSRKVNWHYTGPPQN